MGLRLCESKSGNLSWWLPIILGFEYCLISVNAGAGRPVKAESDWYWDMLGEMEGNEPP